MPEQLSFDDFNTWAVQLRDRYGISSPIEEDLEDEDGDEGEQLDLFAD